MAGTPTLEAKLHEIIGLRLIPARVVCCSPNGISAKYSVLETISDMKIAMQYESKRRLVQ